LYVLLGHTIALDTVAFVKFYKPDEMKYLLQAVIVYLAFTSCVRDTTTTDENEFPTIEAVWKKASLIYEQHGIDTRYLAIDRAWYDSIARTGSTIDWNVVEASILENKDQMLELQAIDDSELVDELPPDLKKKLEAGFASEEEYLAYKKKYPRYME